MSESGRDTDTLSELSLYHRRILSYIDSYGGSMSTVQLAKELAANQITESTWEAQPQTALVESTPRSLQQTYVELVTKRLPVLEKKGFVTYCDYTGEISVTASEQEVAKCLGRGRSN